MVILLHKVGEETAAERKVLMRPAGNQTGDLSLMRRVWYHKTTASAISSQQLARILGKIRAEYDCCIYFQDNLDNDASVIDIKCEQWD
jgi:hypothetical protein